MEKNKKGTVMLVEDDPSLIDIYATTFEQENIGLDVVSLGKDAIKKIQDSRDGKIKGPDLVLLDLVLPDINGLEVLKDIKNNAGSKKIPVFILSNETTDTLDGPDGVKPDKFIVKADITLSKLINLVKESLKKSAKI